jgi:hypothetical protein
MDENEKFKLSQIIMERMELKSTLKEISYLMQVKPNVQLTHELDRVLDRLKVLEMLENEIRKKK